METDGTTAKIPWMARGSETEETCEVWSFHAGQWGRTAAVWWSRTDEVTRKDGSKHRFQSCGHRGFEESPAEVFGLEFSVTIEVYRATGSKDQRLLVDLEMGGQTDAIICQELPDFLVLINQLLPLVKASREHELNSEARRHYEEKHWRDLQNYGPDFDCSLCIRAAERSSRGDDQ